MDVNPLAFLVGGLALLTATLVTFFLNRRAAEGDNPYDVHEATRDLSDVLWGLRNADALYRAGLEAGHAAPRQVTPEALAETLGHAGLGETRVHHTAQRVEWHVRDGPFKGVPSVDEPLCYFTLGLLRGAMRDPRVYEEACNGTGAPGCVFVLEVKGNGER